MAIVENYTTSISATKTAAEIQRRLAESGASKVMIEYRDSRPSGVVFEAQTEFGPRSFVLPIDVDAMHQLLVAEKRAGRLPGISAPLARDRAQAERVAWRVVAEWVRAQMTLIAARMATLDQVMLPYLVVDGQRSLYEAYRSEGLRELTGGQR
ncbi:MAG: hypothetical protein CVT66_06185 [Actinobacteria bacterium HGW-Actinobacteria-6]|nr:MAG: hypothetical protein CVT66_06185 [Actinobacteria bacterium HGW-Actinobacteria-6]